MNIPTGGLYAYKLMTLDSWHANITTVSPPRHTYHAHIRVCLSSDHLCKRFPSNFWESLTLPQTPHEWTWEDVW